MTLPPGPVDPRSDLPAFGSLPVIAALDELVTRVIAPNASALTLDGTNTYVVGRPGSGVALVVDPGPDDAQHLEHVLQVLAARDAQVAGIVVTHHHGDHAAAARSWGRHFGAPVHAPTAEVAGPDGLLINDGDRLGPPDARVEAVATPGHCADHTAFRTEAGALLVGDHVLGRGTSVVAHPDGDLLAYLDSLAKIQQLGPDALFPGHGPELTEDPGAVLDYYRAHRAHREAQVLEVLAGRDATPRQIVEVIYAAHDRGVWSAAEASTRAALAKLANEGRVAWHDGQPQVAARLLEQRSHNAASDADMM